MDTTTRKAELERRLHELQDLLLAFDKGADTPVGMEEEWARARQSLQVQREVIEQRLIQLARS